MIRLAVSAALLLIAGGATAQNRPGPNSQARLDMKLAGWTAGPPQKCVRRTQVNEIRSYEKTILYMAGRKRAYRNDVVGNCPGLARGDIVVVQTLRGDRYCDGDFVQTRAPSGGMITGSCSLGAFVPYTR
ncbi:hypothetical protein [Sphingomonas sp.]|uniref:hypothetical protein n=1 Tax=Sphingomonas sp. TaxID=28214 RepID=UPI002EDA78E3